LICALRRRPSRFGYVLGGAIIVLSVIGGILFFVIGSSRTNAATEAFVRVPVAERAVVTLGEGEQVIYVEPNTLAEGESAPGEPVDVTVASQSGRPVPLSDYSGSFTYESGRAYQTFEVPAGGRFEVVTRPGEDSSVENVAIGPGLGRSLAVTLIGGFGLLFGGPPIGVLILIVTAILRSVRRPDRAPRTAHTTGVATAYGGEGRYGPAGGGAAGGGSGTAATGGAAVPGAVAAGPGWYGDPYGHARLRYWDGGRWTEHTAA
jgi:hypothetical protein